MQTRAENKIEIYKIRLLSRIPCYIYFFVVYWDENEGKITMFFFNKRSYFLMKKIVSICYFRFFRILVMTTVVITTYTNPLSLFHIILNRLSGKLFWIS